MPTTTTITKREPNNEKNSTHSAKEQMQNLEQNKSETSEKEKKQSMRCIWMYCIIVFRLFLGVYHKRKKKAK